MPKKITKPHDLTFKNALENSHVARGLLKQYLPQDLLAVLDLSTLKQAPNSFVSDELKEYMSDVVYQVQIAKQPAYISFILEHQSTPQPGMTFRITEYKLRAMAHSRKQHPNQKAALVHCILIYNGKRPFPYPTDIREEINAPEALINKYLFESFQLVDLTQITDDQLRQEIWSGFLLVNFKHVRDRHLVKQFIDILLEIGEELMAVGAKDYLWVVLKYLIEATEAGEKDLIQLRNLISERLSHEIGEKMATLAQRLEKRGEARGEARGIEKASKEFARKLLIQQSTSIEDVAHLTNLPVPVVMQLKKSIKDKH